MELILSVLSNVWAKSSGESLAEHTYKVLSVLAQLRNRSPYLSSLVGEQRLWHWAFWSCFLHDFGKAAKSFQSYLRSEASFWKHRHEIFSLSFLQALQFDENDFPWIIAGIASHHKDAIEIIEGRYDLFLEPEDLALDDLKDEIDEDTIRDLLLWLKHSAKEWIIKNNFNGVSIPIVKSGMNIKDFILKIPETVITTLKIYNNLVHNITSKEFISSENRIAILLRGLVVQADHLASANAPKLKIVEFPDNKELSTRLGIKEGNLKSHQKEASLANGSIILSAPTGSGKTEAALLWAHKQQINSGIQRHLIYILPYQASLNANYIRLKEIVGCEVALIHGRSLQAIYREMKNKGYSTKEADIIARRANDLAQLYQPPIWCTTPYQLLRAVYRLPGYESLWTGIAGALVIIDEVHAYEPSRLGILIALISELIERWGVSLCIMTATMPNWLRKILSSLVDLDLPIDEKLFNAFKRHKIEIMECNIFDSKIYKLVKEEVSSGKSILVGVNTVKIAQKVYREIKRLLGSDKVILIHSRFTSRDRLIKEKEILEKIGTKAQTPTPIAVVATQVIEVSLDLDFDTIITEPAPLEALIQRFGRINRKGKKGIVPVRILTQSMDDEKVYNKSLVSRAISVLRKSNNFTINELNINEWLDEIYTGLESEFTNEVLRHKKEFQVSCLKTLKAFNSSPALAEQFDKLFDNTEVLPKCLEKKFKQLYEQSVIEAKSLLVPISWKQLYKNKNFVTWNNEWYVRIIDKSYDSNEGLLL